MNDFKIIAGFIIITGAVLLIAGIFLLFIGKLPGDIMIRKGSSTFFFPIVTCIILSIIITVAINIFYKH